MLDHRLLVLDDFARQSAGLVEVCLIDAVERRGLALMVLAGGGTPLTLYRELSGSADLPWSRIHFFWGDERLVPPDDPGSNFGEAWEAILSKAPIPQRHIHRIRGELAAEAAVADYVEQLGDFAAEHAPDRPSPWPRFDLVLLGLGEDGHTASLFPGSAVHAPGPVMAVSADYHGRPSGRVTLTPPVFNDAHQIMFLVTGSNKADAVYETLHVDDPARYPAQRIRPVNGNAPLWLLDRDAAHRLTD